MSPDANPVVSVPQPPAPVEAKIKPTVIMTELDSYIYDRIQSQPGTLVEVEERAELQVTNRAQHRLVLPEFFEKQSYDCTLGTSCSFHKWKYTDATNTWTQESHGKFLLRWLFKEKRAIDRAANVLGWTIVSRSYFPDCPNLLFTANGGVEVGDAILAFMPAKKAMEIREDPGRISRELLKGRMTNIEEDYVLMTGNPKDQKFYQPKVGAEEAEGVSDSVPGAIVEGRDF